MTVRQFVNNNLSINYDITLFEKGLEWIDNYSLGNNKAAQMMSQSKIFWAWWRNQWRNRTEQCIYGGGFDLNETDLSNYEKEVFTDAYHAIHNINNTRHIYLINGMCDLMLQIKNDLKATNDDT